MFYRGMNLGSRVDAVAQAALVARPLVENVAVMPVTIIGADLRAVHPEQGVAQLGHVGRLDRFREARTKPHPSSYLPEFANKRPPDMISMQRSSDLLDSNALLPERFVPLFCVTLWISKLNGPSSASKDNPTYRAQRFDQSG